MIVGVGYNMLYPLPETDHGRQGRFDVCPYLQFEAFGALNDKEEFAKVMNGGYFVEWDCGADLSADTIEARWQVVAPRN